MQNSGPTPSSENFFFSVLSQFWHHVIGESTPNEGYAAFCTSDTSSAGNELSQRGLGSVYDDIKKALTRIFKARGVEFVSNREVQPIKQLPDSLKDPFAEVLCSYLSNKDLVSLSASCWQLRSWTSSKCEKRALTLLMLAVVHGNEDEAKRLLALNPLHLRINKTEVIDYSGRVIKQLTPFQAALCAGDVEMCEMMKTYFAQLEDGQVEFERQYHEIFSNGIDAQVALQKSEVFDFTTILNAIKNASDADVQTALNKEFEKDTPLNRALNEFREQFHRKSLSEMIYNPQHLLRAFQMNISEVDNLATWEKRDLFWRQVTGFVQRYLPACYAQAFANHLFNIVYFQDPLKRSLKFKCENIVSIMPLSCGSGLGFDWAVVPGDCDSWELSTRRARPGIHERLLGYDLVFKIMSSKNIQLARITQAVPVKMLGNISLK